MALITAPKYGNTSEILGAFKQEFNAQHILSDVLGTYGFIPVHEPDGEPVNAFEASTLENIPAKLLRSKSITFSEKGTNDKSGGYIYLIREQAEQKASDETGEKKPYEYRRSRLIPGETLVQYIKSGKTPTGYLCWVVPDGWKHLRQRADGKFETKALVHRLYPVTTILPDVLRGAHVKQFNSTLFGYPCRWSENGLATAKVGEGYWLIHGQYENGAPKFRFIDRNSDEYAQLIVSLLDGNGEVTENLGRLTELDSVKIMANA